MPDYFSWCQRFLRLGSDVVRTLCSCFVNTARASRYDNHAGTRYIHPIFLFFISITICWCPYSKFRWVDYIAIGVTYPTCIDLLFWLTLKDVDTACLWWCLIFLILTHLCFLISTAAAAALAKPHKKSPNPSAAPFVPAKQMVWRGFFRKYIN